MKCYKLVNKNMTAHNGFKYELGVRAEVEYTGRLCSPGVLHVYDSPEDAVFFNLIHGDKLSKGGRLFEAEFDGPSVTDRTKRGVGNLTLTREIPVAEMSTEQRVERATRAALTAYKDPAFVAWADGWLNNVDRSREAAAKSCT